MVVDVDYPDVLVIMVAVSTTGKTEVGKRKTTSEGIEVLPELWPSPVPDLPIVVFDGVKDVAVNRTDKEISDRKNLDNIVKDEEGNNLEDMFLVVSWIVVSDPSLLLLKGIQIVSKGTREVIKDMEAEDPISQD